MGPKSNVMDDNINAGNIQLVPIEASRMALGHSKHSIVNFK
jgi:hypothetical protein